MTDERLKELIGFLRGGPNNVSGSDLRDAADELEALRKALKPFTDEWHAIEMQGRQDEHGTALVYMADLKRAAEVLK